MARPYTVEGWKRLDCLAFRSVARPSTVKSTADHYILDRDCDRVYVSGPNGEAATWQATGGWRIRDERLRAALTEEV